MHILWKYGSSAEVEERRQFAGARMCSCFARLATFPDSVSWACTTIQTEKSQAPRPPEFAMLSRGAAQSSWRRSTRNTTHLVAQEPLPGAPARRGCLGSEAQFLNSRQYCAKFEPRSREATMIRAGQGYPYLGC